MVLHCAWKHLQYDVSRIGEKLSARRFGVVDVFGECRLFRGLLWRLIHLYQVVK